MSEFSLILVLQKENKQNSNMTWQKYKLNLSIVLPNFRPAERGFKTKISRQCEPDSSLG